YGMLANGGRIGDIQLVSPESTSTFSAVAFEGTDVLFGFHARSALGYARSSSTAPIWFGPNDSAFGFSGLGGNMGYADPTTGIGFGYVVYQWRATTQKIDRRANALMNAFYDALAAGA